MRNARICQVVLLLLVLVSTRASHAQASAVLSGKLSAIRVSGSVRFDQAELDAVTGLSAGEEASQAALQEGANRLASTGMFTEVSYTYVEAPRGVTVEYKVEDSQTLVPAHFDNFVWMSRAELIAELKHRVPLFTGEIPTAGEMANQIAASMQAILAARGIQAPVREFPTAPAAGGSIIGFLFTVDSVKVPIQSVEFLGASPELQPVLQKTAARLAGADYSETRLISFGALDVLPEYRKRGYLRAAVAAPAAEIVDASSSTVKVSLPVTEGFQYRFGSISWNGNTALKPADLSKWITARSGEIANQVELQDDLDRITKIYGTRGYLEAKLSPNFTFDDAAHSAAVAINIDEGPIYHMGKLDFQGITPESAANLAKQWSLAAGEPYDSSYPELFAQGLYRQFNLRAVDMQIHTNANKQSHSVDVTVLFKKMVSQ